MSKDTKEIDVWIIKNENKPLEKDHLLCCFSDEERDNWLGGCDEVYKAKLIIEIPEKKIEITERQFDDAFTSSLTSHNNCLDLGRMKKLLGFKDD